MDQMTYVKVERDALNQQLNETEVAKNEIILLKETNKRLVEQN